MMTKSGVRIRRGTTLDLPTGAELWDRANSAYGRRLAVEHTGAVVIESIARRMREDDADLLIAEVDGKFAGMLLGSPSRADRGKGPLIDGCAHVSWVAVDVAYWGRGIATRLMEELLDVLREKKFVRVQLWTHQDNVRAQRIYERLGFTLTGQQMFDSAGALVIHYGRDL